MSKNEIIIKNETINKNEIIKNNLKDDFAIKSAKIIKTKNDIDIAVKTIYGEARGECKTWGISPFIAISNVILNRAMDPYHKFGDSIGGVCLKSRQFSCWDDHNLNAIKSLKDDNFFYKKILEIFVSVLDGRCPDITGQSDHYYAISLKTPPSWAQKMTYQSRIGNHVFYKS